MSLAGIFDNIFSEQGLGIHETTGRDAEKDLAGA